MLPLPHYLTSTLTGLQCSNWGLLLKSLNIQTKEFCGNPKTVGETNTITLEEFEAPAATENIKHKPAPSQINIKPHILKPIYFSSYYLIHHVWLSIKNYKAC